MKPKQKKPKLKPKEAVKTKKRKSLLQKRKVRLSHKNTAALFVKGLGKRVKSIGFFVEFAHVWVHQDFSVKVLEYLRTCNIFYLINGLRITFGIFD